jgi:hypothetical protein
VQWKGDAVHKFVGLSARRCGNERQREVAPLLMLEATLSPSAEKSLKEWIRLEKSVEVGLERTKHALSVEVGGGGGLVLGSETLNDWGL